VAGKDKSIPDIWRPWLFGDDPPPNTFVVTKTLQRLRKEMSPDGILACREVDLDRSTYQLWRKDPIIRKALDWILQWAAQTGAAPQLNPPWPAEAETLPRMVKDNLLRYARAATLGRCLERVGISRPQYHREYEREAERLEVKGLLEEYLHRQKRFEGPKQGLHAGLVTENFFIPTEAMIAFREAARAEDLRQELTRLLQEVRTHPGYREWFLDWTSPHVLKRRRPAANLLPVNGAPAEQLQAPTSPVEQPKQEAAPSAPQELKPRWDGDRRQLRFGADLCKEYKRPAPRQEVVLASFEELGWPRRIDDPLPKGALEDTVKNLR
jgi:hypothetical protein